MNHVVKKQQGFTLVELVLAMAFIGALLLAIALTIIQVGAIYNQGVTMREINQSSRDISEDLRRNISSAGIIDLSRDYVLTPSVTAPAGGRLCLGNYSYIWNYAKTPDTDLNRTGMGTPPSNQKIALVKVPDTDRSYCEIDGSGIKFKNIEGADVPETQELLKPGDHSLGIHQFKFITPIPTSASNDKIDQALYSIQFTIGTSNVSALDATQTSCLPADNINSDPLYCNVQSFTLVVRAGK